MREKRKKVREGGARETKRENRESPPPFSLPFMLGDNNLLLIMIAKIEIEFIIS